MAPALQSVSLTSAIQSESQTTPLEEWASALAMPCTTDERQVMKKQKIEFAEQQALDTCIRQLEGLLESLKSGTVSLSQGGQKLWLRPGGSVDIELRAEQSGEKESLEIALAWRRASLHVVSRLNDDTPPKTVRNWQRPSHVREAGSRDDLPPPSQRPLFGKLDAASAARYQEIYAAARSTNGEGQHRLDESRFVRALADLGVDQQLQQELYNLALQAEADGRAFLFKDETIAALRKAS